MESILLEVMDLASQVKNTQPGAELDAPPPVKRADERQSVYERRVTHWITTTLQSIRIATGYIAFDRHALQREVHELQNQSLLLEDTESWEDWNNEQKRGEPDEEGEGKSTDDFDEEF